MHPYLRVASLLAAAALTSIAHADTPTNFTITAPDYPTDLLYTLSFSLDPTTPIPEFGQFSFENVNATINSTPNTVEVDIAPYQGLDDFVVYSTDGGGFLQRYTFSPGANGLLPVTGDPDLTSIPTFNAGAYTGYVPCEEAVLRTPSALFPTAALLQLPTLSSNCGGAVTLTVGSPSGSTPTPPPTVTPEPSTLALLGTGAFGVVGVLRRRFSL